MYCNEEYLKVVCYAKAFAEDIKEGCQQDEAEDRHLHKQELLHSRCESQVQI